ncbi:MAG: hypothetical protein GY909_15900 [Oligoflexia bacterium]|nr:hypothetical protein [Oligoflexia bacterium]
MKIVLLTLLFFNFNLFASLDNLVTIFDEEIIENDFDLETNTLQNGSNWEVLENELFDLTCSDKGEFIYLANVIDINFEEYIDKYYSDCESITVNEDPNNLIPWQNVGLVQDVSFGTETLECNIEVGDCNITQSFSESYQNYQTINLEIGQNGTRNGFVNLLLYNIDFSNVQISTTPGVGGSNGMDDIGNYGPVSKYCYTVKDALSEGIASEFAKTPQVNMTRFIWEPIKVNPQLENSEDSQSNLKSNVVIKGLDTTNREIVGSNIDD